MKRKVVLIFGLVGPPPSAPAYWRSYWPIVATAMWGVSLRCDADDVIPSSLPPKPAVSLLLHSIDLIDLPRVPLCSLHVPSQRPRVQQAKGPDWGATLRKAGGGGSSTAALPCRLLLFPPCS
jgi:hypothetical protein